MKPVEIVLRKWERGKRENDGGGKIQLRYTVNIYVNITMYPPIQLLYANKIIKEENAHLKSAEFGTDGRSE
jgi:hypothetical protein